MARGKYRAKAQRREAEIARAEEAKLRAKVHAEEERRSEIDRMLGEMDHLTTEALQLRAELMGRNSPESQAIRAEIGQLLREIAELAFTEDRERRSRDRRGILGNGVAAMEALVDARGADDDAYGALVTEGVHVKPGMTSEQVEVLQRARGLRRRGALSRSRSAQHSERLERIERETGEEPQLGR